MTSPHPLEQCIHDSLERYFADLGDAEPRNLLAMVLNCVEGPVLQVALQKAQGNQSRAADMLGITRSTLRKKLQMHNITPNSFIS